MLVVSEIQFWFICVGGNRVSGKRRKRSGRGLLKITSIFTFKNSIFTWGEEGEETVMSSFENALTLFSSFPWAWALMPDEDSASDFTSFDEWGGLL